MVDTTDIEKKSLEAHVELCAERYKFLEEKLNSLEEKISALAGSIAGVRSTLELMATKNNDRLITWGLGIIAFLTATVGWLVQHYIFN
jgi:hypothetical protein